ncbi:MAG: Rieske (2Fe-2S) protein [Gemmatimonadetes bacterium]|nr:MAG: Rieske (2Fe-2S) protein [Gemmatimonadota bacterium]
MSEPHEAGRAGAEGGCPAGEAPTRRAFLARLSAMGMGAGCMGALPLLEGCASVPFLTPVRTPEGGLRVPLDAFDTAPGVLVDFPEAGMPIYVHRHGPGRFTAVLTRCTHQGCQAEPDGSRIVCPCHGSEYGPDGRVLKGPAERDLAAFPVRIEGGTLTIVTTSRGSER